MVVRARNRWAVVLVGVGLATLILWRENWSGSGIGFAATVGVFVLVALRMRVVADNAGLRVVNLAWPRRIRWEEIEGFQVRGYGWWTAHNSLEIRLKDGRRVRAWALSTDGLAAYSYWAADKVLAELRRRLAEANGETTDEADARALDEALQAAEAGDYVPFWELAGDFRIDPERLWGRVDELAARGRIDYDALRGAGPKLSRSFKRHLARKHPELAAELEDAQR